jgi:hypothetical protein
MPKMVCSEDPLSIMCKHCRKLSDGISGYLNQMLFTKSGDSFENYCFEGIHKTICNNLYLDGLPPKDRILGNSDSGTAARDSNLRELTTLILGWVPIVKYTKRIPQDFRKPFPM